MNIVKSSCGIRGCGDTTLFVVDMKYISISQAHAHAYCL